MRIFLLNFLIINILLNAQASNSVRFKGELIIHLINYDSSMVAVKAERILNQGGKWFPGSTMTPYSLIVDSQFDNVIVTNKNEIPEYPSYYLDYVFFDYEGDDKNVLALSIYGIYSPVDNSTPSFYVNTVNYMTNWKDIDITFDYLNNYFYWGKPTNLEAIIPKNYLIQPFDSRNTDGLEDYWYNALFFIPDQTDDFPRLVWGPIPNFNATNYKVYRAISNTATPSKLNYDLISSEAGDVFDYVDEDILLLG